MKTTLIVIQSDADHAQAKALIQKLMDSRDPADVARMAAQACLTEAYERSRWPRRVPSRAPDPQHRRTLLGRCVNSAAVAGTTLIHKRPPCRKRSCSARLFG